MPQPPAARWLQVTLLVISAAALVAVVLLSLLEHRGAPVHAASPTTSVASAQAAAPSAEPKRMHIPDFSLVDQHHATVTPATLAGEPFIADFIYTQCTTACPMITARMVQLQRRLRDRRVRFVSFSIDPVHDTPEALAAYAKEWNAAETRWTLLATTPKDVDELMKFGILVVPSNDPEGQILHSDVIVLVDADGFIRGRYDSESDAALDRLVELATQLSMPEEPQLEAKTNLYASLGCAGCHDRPAIAPPLVNLRGAHRVLDDGRHVIVDDDYLRRAIVDPSSERVAGYSVAMPSYRTQLDDAQLNALIAELDARVDTNAAPADVAPLVTDPVCSMKIRAEKDAPHVRYQDKDYYFCSETCRSAFAADPKRYVGK